MGPFGFEKKQAESKSQARRVLTALCVSSIPSQSSLISSMNFRRLWIVCLPILPMALLKNFPILGCLLVENIVSRSFCYRYTGESFEWMHLMTKFAWVYLNHSVGAALLQIWFSSFLVLRLSKSNTKIPKQNFYTPTSLCWDG